MHPSFRRITPLFYATLGCILAGCVPESRDIYKDDKVKVVEKSMVNLLAVHSSHDTEVLTIFGKDYKEVRGSAPYYLEIPQLDSILFVTGRSYDNGQATVHIVNLKTKKEFHFNAYDSHIGENIGPKQARQFEQVESVNDGKIVIKACFLDGQFRYHLDLGQARFEKEEADFWDKTRGVTNHYVYVDGKAP